jgi:ABC-2 type transport system ATP-binding protein
MKQLLAELDTQIFILDTADELFQLPALSLDQVSLRRIDSHSIEVNIASGVSINDVFSQLGSSGVRVSSMRNKTNRLEQLFLSKLNGS